jgi:hypothetical protein
MGSSHEIGGKPKQYSLQMVWEGIGFCHGAAIEDRMIRLRYDAIYA